MNDESNPAPLGDRLDDLRLSGLARIGAIFRGAWGRVPAGVRNFWPLRIVGSIINLVRRNRVLSLAAEISFWAVLSVVPLGLVAVSALGWLDAIVGTEVADDARRELSELVTTLLGTTGTASGAVDNLFAQPDTGAFTIGLIIAVYSSSRGFTSLVGALGLISGHQSQRNWLMTRVVGVLVAIISIVVINGLLILLGVGRAGFGLPEPWSDIVGVGLFPAIFLVVIGWALVLLHWAPQDRTPLRNDMPGGILTAVFWIAGSYLTALYIAATSSATDPVGLLGSGVGLLIWLYVISASILIGAQLNAAIQLDRESRAALRHPATDHNQPASDRGETVQRPQSTVTETPQDEPPARQVLGS